MKVIIIDDSKEFLALVRRRLAHILPDIEVTEYDPEQQGKPGPEFDWSLYDLVFLDYRLGPHDSGLEWLREFRQFPAFPPTVMMTAAGDEYMAAEAIKRGAIDYVKKEDVSTERLTEILQAISHGDRDTVEETPTAGRLDRDAAIVESVRYPREAGDEHPDGAGIGYRFVRLIGQGASSRVYLAERLTDRFTLVLKIIDVHKIHEPQVVKRFAQEADLVAGLDSPFVVRCYDHGFTPDYGYIAMEFFTRGDLKQRIEHGIPAPAAVNYLHHIAYGLRAIHRCGIIHRDLKPGNVMFRSDDSLALADFGISKRIDGSAEITRIGSVLGTPNYMSPEQALGQGACMQSDLYAAGVMLFEMLTGSKPYRADTAAGLVYQHVHAPIPRLPRSVARYQELVDRLLAKEPGDRFPDAQALIDTLYEFNTAIS